MFLSSINPLSEYATPDGDFASTGKETTVYFFPATDCIFTVALGAIAASFRKPGGESVISSFAVHAAVAAMFAVFAVSAPGSNPPPPGSIPVLGSAGRD
jgi:hypothetical protein